MPITNQLVKEFYAAALKQYDAEVVNKHDSSLMKLVSSFLDGIGVLDKDDFMKHFVTTIGDKIYIPYEVGVEAEWDLWGQVRVLIHELTHVQQYRHAPAEFMVKYITDRSDRATYEAQAYGADLEMEFWKTGAGYDIDRRVKSLLSYGLKQEHCDYAAQYLLVYEDVLKQGGSVSPVAVWAKEWLDQHGAKS